jgi:glycosyltransferase involved in cell wall biosynthesis
MQRVVVVINNTGVGGTERRLGRLFARMAMEEKDTVFVLNRGLWAKLIAAEVIQSSRDRTIRLAEPFGWVAARLPGPESGIRFLVRKLDYLLMTGYLLLRYGFASRRLFHVALGGAYIALPLMMIRRDHRYVISVTDPNLSGHVGSAWALPLFRSAIQRSHAVDALTEDIACSLENAGVDRDKVLCSMGSVVDTARFRPSAVKEPLVVFAGRLVEEKNPLLFLAAMPAIHRAIPEARFGMFGEGPLRERVEAQIDRLGLRTVIRTGFVNDMAPILGPATIFVSLQRRDNFPSQGLLEAMASGLATVATDVGLTHRLVDEETGVRVPPSADRIAQAVIDLLRHPERCRIMGERARQRVSDMHSEHRYQAHLSALYARVECLREKAPADRSDASSIGRTVTKS